MKDGLEVGQQAEVMVVVTEAMRPQFDGNVVHDVYSTAALVHQMEHAARKLLLPYLEANEEGMGVSVSVNHLAPTPLGKRARAVATVADFSLRKIVADVEVWSGNVKVAEGAVVQAVLPKTVIQARIQEMKKQ